MMTEIMIFDFTFHISQYENDCIKFCKGIIYWFDGKYCRKMRYPFFNKFLDVFVDAKCESKNFSI